PLGFSLDAADLKRAGLDYWDAVDLWVHHDWPAFREAVSRERCLYFSAQGVRSFWEAPYRDRAVLVFGNERDGLPDRIRERHADGLDQWESAPIEGFDTRVVGANNYRPAAGSEIVVVTAGIARKPGMSRDDLVRTNADIVKQVSREIQRTCPNAIVVVVSNPLDVMCWVTKQVTGFPRERVLGMAGVLDTARYRAFLAEALDVSGADNQSRE